MSSCQLWNLTRAAGILTPTCSIARINRAVFAGPRHQREIAPEDEEDLLPLTPRRVASTLRLSGFDKLKGMSAAQQDASDNEPSEAGSSAVASGSASPLTSSQTRAEEERKPTQEMPAAGNPSFGKKFVRKTAELGKLAHVHSPGNPLLFRQFAEGVVRLAIIRFPHERGLEVQLQRIFKEQVVPNLCPSAASQGRPSQALHWLTVRSPFAIFNEADVQEVVKEMEPVLWKLFRGLAGEDPEVAPNCEGGGVLVGVSGVGKACNVVNTSTTPSKHTVVQMASAAANASAKDRKKKKSMALACSDDCPLSGMPLLLSGKQAPDIEPAKYLEREFSSRRFGDWAGVSRQLHVRARYDVTLRIKDILRFLEILGLLKNMPLDTSIPLAEALASDDNLSSSNVPGPAGLCAVVEEVQEETGEGSEEEEGSGASGLQDDEMSEAGRRPLLGISKLNFFPPSSLLGKSEDKESKKKKSAADKASKAKEKEQSPRDSAASLAAEFSLMDLTSSPVEILRVLAQVLPPASLSTLQWTLPDMSNSPKQPEESHPEALTTLLEYMETELVFAEFLRLMVLLAEHTTKKYAKWCENIPQNKRLESFLHHVLGHLANDTRQFPNEQALFARLLAKESQATENPPRRNSRGSTIAEEPAEVATDLNGPAVAESDTPSLWLGFDGFDARASALRAPRRWPIDYQQAILDW